MSSCRTRDIPGDGGTQVIGDGGGGSIEGTGGFIGDGGSRD